MDLPFDANLDLPHKYLNLVMGISVIVGLLKCFYGYRIFKVILALTGFTIGAVLAGAIGYGITQEAGQAAMASLVGGLIGALLMVALHYLGVFLLGALVGGGLGYLLYAFGDSSPETAVLLTLAVLGASSPSPSENSC